MNSILLRFGFCLVEKSLLQVIANAEHVVVTHKYVERHINTRYVLTPEQPLSFLDSPFLRKASFARY
jgi:hypothetical protein